MKNRLYIILWGLICVFSFNTTSYAKKDIDLNKTIIEFKKEKKYNLQGFTVTDKYLFMVMVGYDDTKSIVKVYDLDTNKLVHSLESNSLGHANDVTYNKKDNKIYVLASGGSNEIYIFNGDTFDYEGSFKIEVPARSITYIEDEDIYAVRTVSVGYLLNNKFKLISKIPFVFGMNFNVDLGRQGWSYYNKHIYYTNWSWVRYGGDGSNIIYIYDLNGKIQDIWYTSNDIGEIENISFYKDKMVLGFNGYDGNVKFYITDIPTIDNKKVEIRDSVLTEKHDEPIYLWLFISIFSIISILAIIYVITRKK